MINNNELKSIIRHMGCKLILRMFKKRYRICHTPHGYLDKVYKFTTRFEGPNILHLL